MAEGGTAVATDVEGMEVVMAAVERVVEMTEVETAAATAEGGTAAARVAAARAVD